MSPLFEDELYDSGVSHLLVRITRHAALGVDQTNLAIMLSRNNCEVQVDPVTHNHVFL
ncbi:hypothetical protein BGW80DRAFT_1341160 [Lactifluus volemus]|nr:hypothetical protein BGW80DRAFT_1341160 [Lactifluus volemus]